MNKKLLLEDGTEYHGTAFGSLKDVYGEVVFTTSMTGYQELLTDPSLLGQMLIMTYPMIGNCGVNRDDYEAMNPFLSALLVKEYAKDPSNFRMKRSLEEYLIRYDVPGLSGVDTRMLTRHIREKGAMKGCIVSGELSTDEGLRLLGNHHFFRNHIERASTRNSYVMPSSGKRVVLMDFGMKGSILKELVKEGFHVTVVPHDTDVESILEMNPDGILLSNGPGDPVDASAPLKTIRALLGRVPIFGICMGHQLLALASGGSTRKMKFGHRGGNNAVMELATGKVIITSQNHGYEVDEDSLEGTGLSVTHRSINDGSVEGLESIDLMAFSVQFHPESAPGPSDARIYFSRFRALMEEGGMKNA